MSNENTPAEPEQQDSGTPAPESAETDTSAAEPEGPSTEPTDTEPTDTESADSEFAGTEPIDTESAGTEPIEPAATDTDPAATEPIEPVPTDTDTEPTDTEFAAGVGDGPGTPGDGGGSDYVPPSTPPPPMVPPVRRLVRDPYTRLGGVASGVAHHYGIDVSLVRLGFILFTLFSGVGIVLYLLAWLIIPRAEYWPPAPPPEGRSLSSALQGRELGYGLLAVGILLAIFAGGGDAARLLVSVGLVGAGIWMLVQPNASKTGDAAPVAPEPSEPVPTPVAQAAVSQPATVTEQVPSSWQPAAPGDATSVSGPDDTMVSNLADTAATVPTAPAEAGSGGSSVYTTTQPAYVPQPVPPRRRRVWPIFLILAILVLPLLFVAAVVGLAIASEEGISIDVDADNTVELTPLTLDDLPASIDEGAGEIVIDLTELDTSSLDDADLPQIVDIDLNAGEVNIEVPDDLPVNVDASVGAGDISVFDDHSDGIRPRVSVSEDDAVVDFDIRVGVGEVTVDR